MGNCACFHKIGDEKEIKNEVSDKVGNIIKLKSKHKNIPSGYDEKLYNKIKTRLSSSNIDLEKITESNFNEILSFNDNANNLFNEYEEQLDDLTLEQNKHLHTEMPPLKFINNSDQEIVEYYQGEYDENGFFCGSGIYITKDLDIFYGQFKDDEYNGKGLLITHNGNSIFGNWENGECNGFGILKIVGKYKYTGEFLKNVKNGHGVEEYEDGSKYDGNFKNGVKSGFGKFTFNNGQKYEGNFENDLYNGKGKYEWPEEGRKYEGQFKNNNMEGDGINTFGDGSIYEGKYIKGLKHGKGVYIWPDGTKFYGNWVNNELHGKGYYESGGEKYEIIFRFGKIISSKYAQNNNNKVKFDIDDIEYIDPNIDKNKFICPICNKLLNNPYQCKSCYNNFCLDCINKTDGFIDCPNCKENSYELNLYLLHELVTSAHITCNKCNLKLDYKSAINHYHN